LLCQSGAVRRDQQKGPMVTIFGEFRKFVARGNVLDLAVGVMIGAAFGKIVTSMTENVLMPVIGLLFGQLDFSKYFVLLGAIPPGYKGSPTDYAALKAAGVPMLGYGEFITQVVNFLITAMVLFMLVRSVNRLVDALEREKKETPAVPTDPQLDVLREILGELRKVPK
jgi:large conductance mechanosensitive channel